jgi:hypothetical protein
MTPLALTPQQFKPPTVGRKQKRHDKNGNS